MSYLTMPFVPAFNLLGLIAPDANLKFYLTETTTPANVYADPDLSTSLGAVVNADAFGRFVAIYLDPSITYRVRLETSLGALIQEADGITGGANASDIGFLQSGSLQTRILQRGVSITDYGGVEGLATDNTSAFNLCLTALGTDGGTIFFPIGDWRGNFVVNQHNITLEGQGGVGELDQTCLRPYATGAATTTVKISDQTRLNRKCGLRNIVISGDNGSGTMAANALWVNGGTVNFWANQVDLMDGTVSLRIEPGGTYPATALKFNQLTIRNDVNSASARAIYVRKYADATGYVTDLQFAQMKVNKTAAGYWLEVDGTGSTGLVVHFSQSYVDHGAGMGILTSAAGLEVIECDGGLQLDPGAAGTVIMKRRDNVKDPTRYLRGHIEGAGGQKIEFLDTTQLTLPSEPGVVAYQPKFESGFFGGIGYYQPDPAAPYSTTVYFDFQSGTGPMRWYGVRHKWMDTTEAADPAGTIDGAVQTLGGVSVAKKVWAGGAVHSNVGFFLATVQVVGARGAAVTAPTGGATIDAESRTAINAIIARLQAHGLIS